MTGFPVEWAGKEGFSEGDLSSKKNLRDVSSDARQLRVQREGLARRQRLSRSRSLRCKAKRPPCPEAGLTELMPGALLGPEPRTWAVLVAPTPVHTSPW